MKILHVVALIQASTGGPAVSVTRLASEQAKMGHEVTLACLDYPHLGPQVVAPGVRVVSVKGNIFAVRGRGWCPEFRRVLREEAAKADVVHNHGLWMWPNAYVREAAVAAGKPLIISPRGMLEAWSLGRSKLRKAVAWRLFERKNLQSAVMFHATAESERESIRNVFSHGLARIDTDSFSAEDLGGKSCSSEKPKEIPIVVAPNGVDLPDLGSKPIREVLEGRFPELKDRRWVVFMSRLHPKKGIDVLLRAWRKQQNVEQRAGLPARSAYRSERSREQGAGAEKDVTCDEWRVASEEGKHTADGLRHTEKKESLSLLVSSSLSPVLVLAGSDLIGYRKDIERMIKELGLEDSVVMTGELAGEEKDCLLGNAEVFVLPSYSENFGIVVAEAMAWGRPVIASTGTPWQEVPDVGAGWWVKPEEDALAQALYEVLGTRQEELDAMGAKGRALVEQRYGWAAPAERLTKAYEEALASADLQSGHGLRG
jgi:glycosyltransferase involved in cell wall biosynthesis